MKEIEYTIASEPGSLELIARQLSSLYEEQVIIKNNTLVFPSSIAKGRFEDYNIDENFTINIIDCLFNEDVLFRRKPSLRDDYYNLIFNVSEVPFLIKKNGKDYLHSENSWENKVVLNSSGVNFELHAPKDVYIRMVAIHFTRQRLAKYLEEMKVPGEISSKWNLEEGHPFSITFDLDTKLLIALQDVLVWSIPRHMTLLYYEGIAKRLIGLICQKLVQPEQHE